MLLLWRNNATINAHVKTQNPVKHQVWHTDPWPNLTQSKSVTHDPVPALPLGLLEQAVTGWTPSYHPSSPTNSVKGLSPTRENHSLASSSLDAPPDSWRKGRHTSALQYSVTVPTATNNWHDSKQMLKRPIFCRQHIKSRVSEGPQRNLWSRGNQSGGIPPKVSGGNWVHRLVDSNCLLENWSFSRFICSIPSHCLAGPTHQRCIDSKSRRMHKGDKIYMAHFSHKYPLIWYFTA